MKALLFEKIVCVWCPWFFGAVFIVTGLRYHGDPVVKVLITGFGLLFMCAFCIAYLLAKLIKTPSEKKD
jgi:hypothetical protein